MDLPTLSSVLQQAISPNPADRKAGEEKLLQFQHAPGHLVNVLKIIVSTALDVSIRQCASIHFKNLVAKDWLSRTPAPNGETSPFADSEKAQVRENILEAVIQAPQIIRSQLGECMKTVIQADYPENWPTLLPLIDSNLKSRDQQRVYGSLYALRILTRKYELKDEDERGPAQVIINTTFPLLIEIFKYMLTIQNPTVDVADLMKLTCKIFWSSTYLEIPKILQEPTTFMAWMNCFHMLLERPVPEEGQPHDRDLRVMWPWWKLRKWILHILNRLYHRFGDPKAAKEENRQFAVMFHKQCAGRFLVAYLNMLSVIRNGGGYLPDRCINLGLQYLTNSISKVLTYQIMKPQMDVIVFEIAFPLMCFDEADDLLWREDPHEYVRKGYDIIEDMYSPRTAAINFISELLRKRGKENLPRFIAYVVDIFTRYQAAPADQKPYRQKDGALLAIGSLSDRLKTTEPYKEQLEHMLVAHVFPDFASPAGHLRAKAAWVAGEYASITFTEPRNFSGAMCAIVNALKDPELPVRVDSVVALRLFVEASEDLNEIRPILPQLLDEFFKLMNEVENEDLVLTLETIVEKFGEEMAPYATGVCQHLATAFWKCWEADQEEEEEDGLSLAAASGCLRAISTMLDSISSLPHLLPQLEPVLLPIMQKLLTSDGQDVYEEVLELVSYMTYYSPTISAQMWTLWPLLLEALNEWAVDFFDQILVPLDNFISRGTEIFLASQDPNFQESLYTILAKILADDIDEDTIDLTPAPKLMESVLQNCKGRVDRWVEPFISCALQRLRRTTRRSLKDNLMEVVANSLYYDVRLTIAALQKMGVTREVFELWFSMLYATNKGGKPNHFRGQHSKKLCILGLASIIALPLTDLPPELQAGLPQMVQSTLKLLAAYKEQVESEEREDEEEEEDDDDDDEDPWEEEVAEEEEEEEEGVDATSKKTTNATLQKLSTEAREGWWHQMNDSDSDDEEDTYNSPIDDVDAFVFFKDIMDAMSKVEPEKFQSLMSGLDFTHQAMAHGIAQHAETRRVEMEKERAEKALAEANAKAAVPTQ